jgi:hypothetical protein
VGWWRGVVPLGIGIWLMRDCECRLCLKVCLNVSVSYVLES